MSKALEKPEIPPDAAPGEYVPITWSEFQALPEDVRQRRARRVYEKFMALKGKVHIALDTDESRGRNRPTVPPRLASSHEQSPRENGNPA
jgi:hypothetical protein